MERKSINVLLDLDNTLIYSISVEKIKKKPWMKKFKIYEMNKDYIVFERPGLQKFLNWIFKHFNVSVWSAATPDYVEFIAKNIIENDDRKLEYVLHSENCEDSQKYYGEESIKKLELLWDVHDIKGFGPDNTLIVDDLGKVYRTNRENTLHIKKFVASEKSLEDKELEKIKSELKHIKKHFKEHVNDIEGFRLIF